MNKKIEKLVSVENELSLAWDVLNSLTSRSAVLNQRRRMRDLEIESINFRSEIVSSLLEDSGYSYVEGLWVKTDGK